MGPVQVDSFISLFIATGLITFPTLWLLRRFLSPFIAIILANLASFAIFCDGYKGTLQVALSIYWSPQLIWLIILIIFLLIRRRRIAAAPAPSSTEIPDVRLEPSFAGAPRQSAIVSDDAAQPEREAAAEESVNLPATAPQRARKTKNIIANHWRGLYSLRVSYWLFGILIAGMSAFGVATIQRIFASDDGYQPVLIFCTVACTWLFLASLTIWQAVGIWRSASRTMEEGRSQGRKVPWARVAKGFVILGALRSMIAFGSAFPILQETYRVGFMGDPDLPGYSLRLVRNGTEAEITGGFKYGLTDDFKKLLQFSPQIKVVHLNSYGGRVGEAIKLNKVIRTAGMKTYVSNVCASACTVAFAGGVERWIAKSAVLGFHSASFPGLNGSEIAAANGDQRDLMIASGYQESFVTQALSIPASDLWKPTLPELMASNVITAVADGTQFAMSGYGGAVQKQIFEAPLATNVPIMGALRERYPDEFATVVDAYYKGYVDGKTLEEDNNIIRFLSYLYVRKHLEEAGDQALQDFGALLVDELTVLKARDPIQCAKFGSTAGGDPDIQYSFPQPIMMRFQSIGANVVKTSAKGLPQSDNAVSALFSRTVSALAPTLPRSQVSLLSILAPNPQQAPDYCVAVLALFQQILKAPTSDAATMLRSFTKPN